MVKTMSKQSTEIPKELPKDLRFFDTSKFIFSRQKFFHLHIPISLSRLLEMKEGDQATIFASLDQKVIVLKIPKRLTESSSGKK